MKLPARWPGMGRRAEERMIPCKSSAVDYEARDTDSRGVRCRTTVVVIHGDEKTCVVLDGI